MEMMTPQGLVIGLIPKEKPKPAAEATQEPPKAVPVKPEVKRGRPKK